MDCGLRCIGTYDTRQKGLVSKQQSEAGIFITMGNCNEEKYTITDKLIGEACTLKQIQEEDKIDHCDTSEECQIQLCSA
jgi:hypothetical protein